jgi:serine/threonine protein kinase
VDHSPESEFERCALASGLLTQSDLDEARAAGPWAGEEKPQRPIPRTDGELADKLVGMGRLNRWQAKQLLEGRTKFSLGPYRIADYIGQGGMGQVFKAEHSVLGRVVAIKVLPRSKSTPEAINNFNREIRAQAKLDHPNLVRAFDAGEDGNVHFLVTEYVPGTDLRKLVRRNGPQGMEAAARIISQVAEGLHYAHGQGMVHRDVKPGNVLVTPEGRAKLSDLGLAGPLAGDAETDPRFGKIVGTADYLSPDHIERPWEPTPAWDIYSLGCTLYYAVTGKVPFPGGTTADKARAHLQLRPLDPRRLNPALSAEFIGVLADMMAKDSAARIQAASEVVARLAPWVVAPAVPARHESPRAKKAGRMHGGASPPDDPDSEPMDDTQSSFPEMPGLSPAQKEGASQASQATHPVGAAGEDTSSGLGNSHAVQPVAIWRPLAVLVLLPIAVVAAIMLIGWLLKAGL